MNVDVSRYYELRSMTGEVELLCVPCYNYNRVHKGCLIITAQESKAGKIQK